MMMTNFPADEKKFDKAATAYRSAYVNNMSGFEVVVELYKGILKNVERAKHAYESGKLDEMCNHIQKTNKILVVLQSHLDFEQGGDAAVFLNEFYNGLFASLAQILRKPDPGKEFDYILNQIKPVYEIWCKHAENTLRKD